MGLTKKHNIINIRKKKCDQCKSIFNTKIGCSVCPYCGSRKIHFIYGGAVTKAGIYINKEMRMYHK
jgi:Zn finger protein HypA/HybF involved in hydrogenase expression